MTIDPGEQRPVTSDMRVGKDLCTRLREEYSIAVGKMVAMVEELADGDLSTDDFVVLHRGAYRTLHTEIDRILTMSVGSRTYAPQRLSTDSEGPQPPSDQ